MLIPQLFFLCFKYTPLTEQCISPEQARIVAPLQGGSRVGGARPIDASGQRRSLQGPRWRVPDTGRPAVAGWSEPARCPPVWAASVIRPAVERRRASILITSRVIRHQRPPCTGASRGTYSAGRNALHSGASVFIAGRRSCEHVRWRELGGVRSRQERMCCIERGETSPDEPSGQHRHSWGAAVGYSGAFLLDIVGIT